MIKVTDDFKIIIKSDQTFWWPIMLWTGCGRYLVWNHAEFYASYITVLRNTDNLPNSINEQLFISDTGRILCEAQPEILNSQHFKSTPVPQTFVP
jgi:hypothetical protein